MNGYPATEALYAPLPFLLECAVAASAVE